MSSESKKPLSADEKAFIEAAAKGDAARVRELLARGVPVDVRDSETYMLGLVWNITALMCAAAQGHLEIVRMLLKAGASVAAACAAHKEDGGGGSQPLHFAMSGRHTAVAEALLDAGADPNVVGNYGRTPLVMAIYEDDIEGVRLLLRRGANVNLQPRRKDYEPALSAAATIKKTDTIHSAKSGGAVTLGLTVELRNPEIFKLVLAASADPNEVGVQGKTPLIRLAWQRDVPDEILIPLMEALLKAGARVDHQEQDGGTALLGAVLRNKPQVVKFLAGAGADVNRIFKRGTLLDMNLEDIENRREELSDPAFTGPARKVVERDLRRYEEVSKILLESGARRMSELAPTPTAGPETASAKSADAVRLGADHFLKFIYDGEAEWSLLAVRAPLKRVADAFMKLSQAKKRERDVPLKTAAGAGAEVAPLVALVQPWDNPWTVIFRSLFHVDEAALNGVVAAARLLSRQLKTKAIAFVAEDKSGALGYDLFEKGKLLERAVWEEGADFTVFESTTRKQPDLDAVDSKFTDEVFRQLGIYLPACYPVTKGKRSWLAVQQASASAVERADLIAL